MYALTENPHIVKRLREEIAEALGDKAPTYADIRDMKYLRAFLNGMSGLLVIFYAGNSLPCHTKKR